MLATRQLGFSYQEEQVLHDLTLDFSQHAVTGVLGANGCGKSTLFMNLTGILQPQQGAVLWQGEPLSYKKANLRELRQRVTTVFQDPEQQIFIPILIVISPSACEIWGCPKRLLHSGLTER